MPVSYFKIISQAYCSSRIFFLFFNMFIVAEIISKYGNLELRQRLK